VTLPCIEYELTEPEALQWLIQRHLKSNGLNAFSRIVLAMELEPSFREKARSNQRAGGQNKGSSNLTEAERLDVRSEIAAAAGVSVGNVTKVKQLTMNPAPELLQALLSGEISIHRAWKWSTESRRKQTEALRSYRGQKGVNKTIRDLISRHKSGSLPSVPDPASVLRRLWALDPSELHSVNFSVIKTAGKAIYVTEELLQSLRPDQEVIPACATNNR